ncbi:MAG TPA: DUF4390 domain-containing protein [Steroidobacteraceae bacterium]|nr:DUF4390 domain-containing protein [Steroidobacteraceae bacterium]
MRGSWGQRLVLLAGLCLMASAALAQNIAVQSAFVNVQGGVFDLNARVIFPLNDDVRTALSDGATVSLELRAVVDRRRRYWFDAEVIDVTLLRELSWNAVSQRYILREEGSTEQQSFTALDQALSAAGQVRAWPVVVEPQLDPNAIYSIRVRASIRRGRLPDTLRTLMFWSDGWNVGSEWYSWILPR